MLPTTPSFAFTAFTLFTLSLSPLFGHAAPTLVYTLMEQEPPIARIDTEFIFSLYPEMFNSTMTITYEPSGMPGWMTWNSASLAFTGTPTAADIGNQTVTLTATDATGSTSSNFTVITTNYTVPGVHQSFTSQIQDPSSRVFSSATPLPGDTGVSVPPYWSFSLGFAADTFRLSRTDPVNGELYIMAHERGTVGLPAWLHFENETMTFNGSAPSYPSSYTIVVTGTDFWGYTGAQSSFVIEVGTGEPIELVKGSNFSDLTTIARAQVDYEVSLANVLYNGSQATTEEVVLSIDQTDFPWLAIDGTTLTGTVPEEYINGTTASIFVPLTISSQNRSSTLDLLTWVPIDITPYFFNTFSLPAGSVNSSQSLSFDLAPYIANTNATVNATVNPTEAASWLVYHENNSSLVGEVPKSPQYDHVDVVFTATQNGQTATANYTITIADSTKHGGTNGTAPVPVKGGDDDKKGNGHGGLSQGAKIGLGVGLAIAGIILLLILLFFCCRRRQRKNNEVDEKPHDDADSFVVGSPSQDPFRRSHGLEPPRNLLGEIARFSGLGLKSQPAQKQEEPVRMDGLKGIFGLADEKDNNPAIVTPRMTSSSSDFMGEGDVIGIEDMNRPSQDDASSFTQSFDSDSSRASWESRESFHWSSGENESNSPNATPNRNRISAAPSIPRPRADFTPRYPRNNSPSRLAQLASQHSLGAPIGGSSSGTGSGSGHDNSLGGTFSSASFANSDFPSGPSGLNRFGDSQGFRSIDEEDEDTSHEEPAVVSMAERQSFETRRPTERPTPKLRPSKERIASPTTGAFNTHENHSRSAFLGNDGNGEEGMYDDAEEYRRSMVGREGVGLGYPASAIFGSEYPETEAAEEEADGQKRMSTITAIPPHANPLSPPLPQVGSFVRHAHTPSASSSRVPPGSANDGRVVACANETFSINPQIHPPPTVSLSAATWSSAPPSTYRAEVEGGGALPAWLHFDARELELWGVPSLSHSGEVTVIKIIEKLPKDKRNSNPMAYGYQPQQEREVGRIAIEVVDRIRSPQFALDGEGSPHAF